MSSAAKQAKRQRQREARKRKSKGSALGGARVLLQRPAGADDVGLRPDETSGNLEAWLVRRDANLRRRIHPIVKLTAEGVDWGATPEAGDPIGYGMHPYRTDDCFQAALATTTQVPIEQVPDLHLDKRGRAGEDPDAISETSWVRIASWAASHGWQMRFWDEPPVPREHWIGVVCSPKTGRTAYTLDSNGQVGETEAGSSFNDHCLSMHYDEVWFDPSCSVKSPPGMAHMGYSADEITYGITFEKED